MSTINTYDLGDKVRCTAEFETSGGAAEDPGSVSFKLRSPGGPVTTYTYGVGSDLVRDSAGTYHVDVLVTASGRWHYRFEGTLSGQAAAEHQFVVKPSRFD